MSLHARKNRRHERREERLEAERSKARSQGRQEGYRAGEYDTRTKFTEMFGLDATNTDGRTPDGRPVLNVTLHDPPEHVYRRLALPAEVCGVFDRYDPAPINMLMREAQFRAVPMAQEFATRGTVVRVHWWNWEPHR